ncbi:unnamed protein product [Adineta steineri]|uniref:Symplekin C-terminal domain-containing protein n=1 Tax=Adineta steineri TaxID=433720 RepID=A0A815PRT9_9BILA|nr:unnamed protein product [Adineta steineri]
MKRDLMFRRMNMREIFLDILLDFTHNENISVRNNAIRIAKSLHDKEEFKQPIERHALQFLKHLIASQPPEALFGEDKKTSTIPKIPVRGMGMNSPKGAKTLITRIIHILTEQAPPSPALIEKVRDLYHKRVSDKEIISALPKLIKLTQPVVKEVFNRPILPFQLLIALHQISSQECELKTVMNAATLCLNERAIYTHDVLAIVIQQLVDINPIPVLFMRTVLQALSFYPKMVGFVMNILQRLITKQARIWVGFIKCCQKTRPHSFPLLLQLPPPQLKHVFQTAPELRDGLIRHIRSMSMAQRSLIPSSMLTVIEDNSENVAPEIRIQTIPTTTSSMEQ